MLFGVAYRSLFKENLGYDVSNDLATQGSLVIAERVNGILKQKFLMEEYQVDIQTMQLLVKDAVRLYNTKRPHYSCYMITPQQMHEQEEIEIRFYKNEDRCRDSPTSIASILVFLSL